MKDAAVFLQHIRDAIARIEAPTRSTAGARSLRTRWCRMQSSETWRSSARRSEICRSISGDTIRRFPGGASRHSARPHPPIVRRRSRYRLARCRTAPACPEASRGVDAQGIRASALDARGHLQTTPRSVAPRRTNLTPCDLVFGDPRRNSDSGQSDNQRRVPRPEGILQRADPLRGGSCPGEAETLAR